VSSVKVVNFLKAELYFFQVCVATAEEFKLLKFFVHFVFCISKGSIFSMSSFFKNKEFVEFEHLYLRMSGQSTGIVLGCLPFGFLRVSEAFLFLSPSWICTGSMSCPRGKKTSHPLGFAQKSVAASKLSSCLAGNLLKMAAMPARRF